MNFKELSVFDTPERSPGFLLWHISTLWRSFIEATLSPLNLTHPQFVVLAAIGWLTRNGDRVAQVVIGKMAGLDPNTTSQIIKSLEQKGFVTREQSSDSRAKNPLLTSKGHEILTQALPAVETTDAQFFEKLTHSEMEHMIRTFQKIMI